jgi:hypothetical protein
MLKINKKQIKIHDISVRYVKVDSFQTAVAKFCTV